MSKDNKTQTGYINKLIMVRKVRVGGSLGDNERLLHRIIEMYGGEDAEQIDFFEEQPYELMNGDIICFPQGCSISDIHKDDEGNWTADTVECEEYVLM